METAVEISPSSSPEVHVSSGEDDHFHPALLHAAVRSFKFCMLQW